MYINFLRITKQSDNNIVINTILLWLIDIVYYCAWKYITQYYSKIYVIVFEYSLMRFLNKNHLPLFHHLYSHLIVYHHAHSVPFSNDNLSYCLQKKKIPLYRNLLHIWNCSYLRDLLETNTIKVNWIKLRFYLNKPTFVYVL